MTRKARARRPRLYQRKPAAKGFIPPTRRLDPACGAASGHLPLRLGRNAKVSELPRLIDPFARAISYLRVSVTDRCDFRCVYCMSEHMEFLPKAELLTLEELDRLCSAFVGLGVQKLRITGGEPLVRKGIMTFFRAMSRHLASGRAQGADADHQRQPAPPLRRRARRLRRPPGQRLARHARRGQVRPHHPLGPLRPGDGRHRGRRRGRPEGEDQRRGAQGRQRRTRCTTSSPGAASAASTSPSSR